MTRPIHSILLIIYPLIFINSFVIADTVFNPALDDQPLDTPLDQPAWFKPSFLDIKEDINEANAGRRGLIIYFGQTHCPYCKAHLKNNWGRRDIIAYTRANFDVIAIDVRGARKVMDIDGNEYSEKIFSARHKAVFTPSLIFFDDTGKHALTLTGYRPPYQFLAALEYVADHHFRKENLRQYLARAEGAESFGQETLNDNDIFLPPPYPLAKLIQTKPLAVFFEERQCHACDILHASLIRNENLIKQFKQLNSVQLDMWSQTPVTTPVGKKSSAKKWADHLGLSYAPTLIFYDESGKEIIRIDSVVGVLRLNNVLRYINTRAYRSQPSFQLWRTDENRKALSTDSN